MLAAFSLNASHTDLNDLHFSSAARATHITTTLPSHDSQISKGNPVTLSVVQTTATITIDPADYDGNGKVDLREQIKYTFEELRNITKKADGIFNSPKVSKHDLKDPSSENKWDNLKAFLDYDENGSISIADIGNHIHDSAQYIQQHALHFKKFIVGYREQLTNNPLYALIPDDAKKIISDILNVSQDAADKINDGSIVVNNVSSNLEQQMNNLSVMITSGQIDTQYLTKNKDHLINLIGLINDWKASGNTSQAANTIIDYLKTLK